MLEIKVLFAIVLFVTLSGSSIQDDSPVVNTEIGKIQGTIMKTIKDKTIYAYRGIRYAKPPVGDLRFKAPEPITGNKDDTIDARNDVNVCPQPGIVTITEDCLMLNVYSTNLTGNASVLFFIHGGANVGGSSHSALEGPQYVLDKDIVLVTINYRLGPLGFLSTGTKEVPGNNGYKDQVLALKWVRQHIEKFGGNPDSITIAGESAGSMAVSLHMVSPMSRGLFHRAIAMSGSLTNHYLVDSVSWTKELAKAVSCPMYNSTDLVTCLRTIPHQTLIDATLAWDAYGMGSMKWLYEIEKDFGQQRFLVENPTQAFNTGNFSKVPLMAGITKSEFEYDVDHLQSIPGLLADMDENFGAYLPEFFQYDKKVEESRHISIAIRKFYFDTKHISNDTIREFGKSYSDAAINHGIHRLVQLARKHTNAFYYRMDYVGRYSRLMNSDGKPYGCLHVDDLQYLFVMDPFYKLIKTTDPEYKMVDLVTSWWTTFAQTGVPSVDSIEWIPSNKTYLRTLYINETSHMDEEPYAGNFALWDDLFPITMSGGVKASISGLIFGFIIINLFGQL